MVLEIVSVLIAALAVVAADECTSYQNLTEPHRSRLFVADLHDKYICDRGLATGWYRFTNGDMPTSCVPILHCGTQVPIWLNGQLPTVPGNSVTLQACYNYRKSSGDGDSDCCQASHPIEVKNCGGYNVYHLSRTSSCNMAYCAGDKRVCKIGQWYDISSNCTDLYPKMTQPPSIGEPYIWSGNRKCKTCNCRGKVKIPCIVDYPKTITDAAFEVTWTVNGLPLRDTNGARVGQNLTNGEREAALDEIYLKGHMDTDLRCEVRSYNGSSYIGPKSDTLTSNPFWVGIRKHNNSLTVDEKGQEQEVTIESTVPIPCNSLRQEDCLLHVKMQTSADPYDISSDNCVYNLTCDPNTHTYSTTIKVVATRDFVTDGDQQHVLAFEPMNDFSRFDTMWEGYTMSPIQIRSRDRPHATCQAVSDPHVVQLDSNKTIDVFKDGNLLLYRSKARKFEVQIKTGTCGGHWKQCTCGIFAREGNDMIQIDVCQRAQAPLTAPNIIYPFGHFTEGTTIDPSPDHKTLHINFPSGAILTVSMHLHKDGKVKISFLNTYLKLPTDDIGNSEGLCGTFDGDPTNDMLGSDGYQHPNQTDFSNSWVIPQGESFFENPPKHETTFDHGQEYCQCENNTLQAICTKSKAKNPLAQVGGKKPRRDSATIKWGMPRQHDDYAEESRIYQKPEIVKRKQRATITRSGMTEAMARATCTDDIRNSTLYNRCRNLLPTIVVQKYVDACVEDMMITDSDIFNIGYMNSIDFQCQDTVLRDVSNYAIGPDRRRIPPADVTTHVCTNQCNRRGTCHQGTCVCLTGYVGADCSVPAGVAPAISHFRGNGLCDTRHRKCMKVQVIAENLVSGPNLKCRYTKAEVGAYVQTFGEYVDAPASLISFLEVECSLPESLVLRKESSMDAFVVSVTTDGTLYSAEHPFLIYDGTCRDCTSSGNCTLKANTCVIGGLCRRAGEENREGGYCDPAKDPYSWTTNSLATEINHYTAAGSGCECSYDNTRFDCACCTNGGCQCGYSNHNICINCSHTSMCSSYPKIIVRN
ncbi:von Willebrand factor D and EGF domain-containing protein-like [Argopecten irradians]|uniref:von Willebrand factor D and EGF domain-containing protein-like n=1 Tax=Argopecten irradians TaxID=31199 RepID=UPI0037182D97